jgi:hypothetical protein
MLGPCTRPCAGPLLAARGHWRNVVGYGTASSASSATSARERPVTLEDGIRVAGAGAVIVHSRLPRLPCFSSFAASRGWREARCGGGVGDPEHTG